MTLILFVLFSVSVVGISAMIVQARRIRKLF